MASLPVFLLPFAMPDLCFISSFTLVSSAIPNGVMVKEKSRQSWAVRRLELYNTFLQFSIHFLQN